MKKKCYKYYKNDHAIRQKIWEWQQKSNSCNRQSKISDLIMYLLLPIYKYNILEVNIGVDSMSPVRYKGVPYCK